MRDLKPGDQVIHAEGTVREIVDVRPTGYGWKYPDLADITPAGGENYFWSENSTDPFFEVRWRRAEPHERVSAEGTL